MPIIQTVQGDLLTNFKNDKYFGIAHGCNCQFAMHSGIAKTIVDLFPDVRETDKRAYEAGQAVLGKASLCFTPYGMIFNMYTQLYPGRITSKSRDEDQIDRYIAISECFKQVNKTYSEVKDKTIFGPSELFGIPKIGAGLAGGNWNDIAELIDDATPDVKIELVEYTG